MEIKASLNNLRMAPRKVRLMANLVKGMSVSQAKAQLAFLVRKPASLILKLINSAAANARHNFSVEESNLYIAKILVEAGPTLKRWLPRAMGRATPIRKRTCSVKLVLQELTPGAKQAKKVKKPQIVKPEEILPERPEKKPQMFEEKPVPEAKPKPVLPARPFGASGQAKKRYFSRQTFGNIRKMFRRKSI
jgi:large subunit ribosomal protein L22